jgi:hypothetical protein
LSKDLENIRALIDKEGEGDVINYSLSVSEKCEVLGKIDDLNMMFQIVLPKVLDINSKLTNKEKELHEVLRNKFNDEVRVFAEKHQNDKVENMEKELINYKTNCKKYEDELTRLQLQIEEN